MEITYRKEGDYLLPNLTVSESPTLGKYGLLRRDFLRDHRNGLYTGLLLSGKLKYHLERKAEVPPGGDREGRGNHGGKPDCSVGCTARRD